MKTNEDTREERREITNRIGIDVEIRSEATRARIISGTPYLISADKGIDIKLKASTYA